MTPETKIVVCMECGSSDVAVECLEHLNTKEIHSHDFDKTWCFSCGCYRQTGTTIEFENTKNIIEQ